MGVSETRSVLDLLPASGPSGNKRANSNNNQMMFGLALKSATAAAPNTSGNESVKKQDVSHEPVRSKGKSVPQNGKDVPDSAQRPAEADSGQSMKTEQHAGAENTKPRDETADTRQKEQNDSADSDREANAAPAEDKKESADNTKPAETSDKELAQAAKDSEISAEDAARQDADLEAAVDEQLTAEQQAEMDARIQAELEQLLADVEQGELTGDELLAKLDKLLADMDLSLDDLKEYLVSEELISSESFDQLLNNPQMFLAQLEQWLKPEFGLAEKLGLGKESTDKLANVAAVIQSFNRQQDTGTAPRFADVLKAEGERSGPDDLVAKLLKEQGAGQEQDSFADKEKLFEQLLQRKVAENPAKTSGFAGVVLKETASSGLAGLVNAGSGQTMTGAEALQAASQRAALATQAQQTMPQLPVLRGLPGQPGATEALNERIMMMRAKGLQVAEIRLDPPDLGSLEIRIRMNGDSTSIQFHSPNAGVREALEAQVNRLREMMEESGVNLAQVDVSDQSLSENSDGEFATAGQGGGRHADADPEAEEEALIDSSLLRRTAPGVVDYFA